MRVNVMRERSSHLSILSPGTEREPTCDVCNFQFDPFQWCTFLTRMLVK